MSASIQLGSTVVAGREMVSADLADEVVILSLKDGQYYGLNSVGGTIWSRLQEPCLVGDLRDHLLQEYPDVEPDVCTGDMLALLEQMAAIGLIEVACMARSQGGR